MRARSLGTLATASALLFAGAWEAWTRSGDDALGSLFLSVGFVVLGVWLAIEVHGLYLDHHNDDRERRGGGDAA